MPSRHGLASFLLVIACCAVARAEPSHDDLATADALYTDGKRLVLEGRVAEACSRFEASMALVSRLGVQINLAGCYEQEGKTASSWVAFGEAAALAHRLADSREAWAWQRHNALAPRLARLAIVLDARLASADLIVKRDGAAVPRSAWGIAIPVDPGEHTLDAEAPGRVAWSMRLRVTREGETVSIAVPELAREHAASSRAATSDAPERRPSLATWLVLGGGAAGIATGFALGVSAQSLWHQAQPGCDSSNACSDRALDLITRSRRDSTLSRGAFAVGGAALLGGALLYLRSPRRSDRQVQIAPALSRHAVGVAVIGGL